MAGKPKPFPRREAALNDWIHQRRLGVKSEEIFEYFRNNYPERFGAAKNYNTVRFAMVTLEQEAKVDGWLPDIPDASTLYEEMVPELRFPFVDKLAVLSDPHASAHDERGIARFLASIVTGKRTVL